MVISHTSCVIPMHRASNSNIPFKMHVLLLEEGEGVEVGIEDDPVVVRDVV